MQSIKTRSPCSHGWTWHRSLELEYQKLKLVEQYLNVQLNTYLCICNTIAWTLTFSEVSSDDWNPLIIFGRPSASPWASMRSGRCSVGDNGPSGPATAESTIQLWILNGYPTLKSKITAVSVFQSIFACYIAILYYLIYIYTYIYTLWFYIAIHYIILLLCYTLTW